MPRDVATDFVDRKETLALFQQMLTGEVNKRILLILEPGEKGKTYFILRLQHECEHQPRPIPVILLDFDQRRSGLTDYLSVSREVRRCLGDNQAPAICACEEALFQRGPLIQGGTGNSGGVDFGKRNTLEDTAICNVAGRDSFNVIYNEASPTADRVAKQMADAGRALCEDLKNLAAMHRCVVLLIDTFEHIPQKTCTWLEKWVVESLRHELPHVIVVIGGRPEPKCEDFFAYPHPWSSLIYSTRFSPISDGDILAHYQQRGLSISENDAKILQIARINPARMAIVGDWLEQTQGGAR